MCFASGAMAGVGLGLQAFGAYGQQKAQNRALEANAAIAEQNAFESERQARDALSRGRKQVGQIHRERDLTIGEQQAALSASGVSATSGSAIDVALDTRREAAIESDIARRNARREARGFLAQARDARFQAETLEAQQVSPFLPAISTFVGQGSQLGGMFQRSALVGDYQQQSLAQRRRFGGNF